MAEVVDQIPPSSKRDYARYFDGRKWKLTLGVDCPKSINVAQNVIRVTARRLKINAEIRQSKKDNAIYVQAILPTKKAKK